MAIFLSKNLEISDKLYGINAVWGDNGANSVSEIISHINIRSINGARNVFATLMNASKVILWSEWASKRPGRYTTCGLTSAITLAIFSISVFLATWSNWAVGRSSL